MEEQLQFHPSGLTASQLDRLSDCMNKALKLSSSQLKEKTDYHLQQAILQHRTNRLVNVRLATAICDALSQVIQKWDSISPTARPWLAGAVLYFTKSDDNEPDFTSPIGFEDDAEVLNACLRFAHLDELCLRPEDYDDV